MEETVKQAMLDKVADDCIEQYKSDWFDLWAVVGRVEHRYRTEDPAEVIRLSLEAVRLLVARGLRAGETSALGYKFWPEKDADAIVARIAKKAGEIEAGRYRLDWVGKICHLGTVEMDEAAKQAKAAEIASDLAAIHGDDWTELSVVSSTVRYDCGIDSNEEVKRLTLAVVRRMINLGLRVGNFKFHGDTDFKPWPEHDAESVVARIDREWDPKRGDPTLAKSICWFE